MLARTSDDLLGGFTISEFVLYLAFVTKLQGFQKKLEEHREFIFAIAGRMLEIEKHRQMAKERRGDEGYVADFVDVLLQTRLKDGKLCSS